MRKEELLQAILQHPNFAHYKQFGSDDWRDPNEKNAGLSLSTKGFFDHKTGNKGSLHQLAKQHNIASSDISGGQEREDIASYIYRQSKANKDDLRLIKKYFMGRGLDLPIEEIKQFGLRVNRYNELVSIVYPCKNLGGKIIQLGQIVVCWQGNLFDDQTVIEKTAKLSKGKAKGQEKAFIFGNKNSTRLVIKEGLEKAVAWYILQGRKDKMLVTNGKAGFSKIDSFLNGYKEVLLILDPDKDQGSLAFSKCLDDKVKRLLPQKEGQDLIDAIEIGSQEEWFNTLQEVSLDQIPQRQTDQSSYFNDGVPDGFTVTEQGNYFTNEEGEKQKFCDTLKIVALARDREGDNWAKIVEFKDPEGQTKQITLENKLLAGDGREIREILFSGGFKPVTGSKQRRMLTDFIALSQPISRAYVVQRNGWHNDFFVLVNDSFFMTSRKEIIVALNQYEHNFHQARVLQEWIDNVARLCQGNSKPIFALSSAFASVLISPLELENVGFHFRGSSSIGKTTLLNLAGSVIGGGGLNGYIQNWRNTSNALEGTALKHCDLLLCLDEMGQVNPKEAGEIAYMLANGAGKGRANRQGEAKNIKEWRILFLSSGELSLSEHMASVQKKAKVGQETRLLDIESDAGKGAGIFDYIPEGFTAEKLARTLKQNSRKYYGTAIRAFLQKLPGLLDGLLPTFMNLREQQFNKHGIGKMDGQIQRVFDRFLLVGYAGELAISMNILPFKKNECLNSALICFNAWLKNRAETKQQISQSLEVTQGLKQVKHFLEVHQESRFTALDEVGRRKDERAKTTNRVGFTKLVDNKTVFLIFPESFKNELCQGFDYKLIAQEMKGRGFLKTGHNILTITQRIEGPVKKIFYIENSFLEENF